MTEWTFQIVRLGKTTPFLDSGVTFAFLVIALELISWHLDRPHMFCMSR
jgi:hypothetical protein